MSCARLQTELLAARDAREAVLGALLANTPGTLVMVSSALPGPDKTPPGSAALFAWGLAELHRRLGDGVDLAGGEDLLGPYRVVASALDARWVKTHCLAIEAASPAARLLDLDVYTEGVRLGRADIGEAARRCLLCEQPAADCIRLRRHSLEALLERVHELLAPFVDR